MGKNALAAAPPVPPPPPPPAATNLPYESHVQPPPAHQAFEANVQEPSAERSRRISGVSGEFLTMAITKEKLASDSGRSEKPENNEPIDDDNIEEPSAMEIKKLLDLPF